MEKIPQTYLFSNFKGILLSSIYILLKQWEHAQYFHTF